MRSTARGACVSKSDSFDSLTHSMTWERASERTGINADAGREKEGRGPACSGTRRRAHHPGRGMADRHHAGFCRDRRPRNHLHHGRDGREVSESAQAAAGDRNRRHARQGRRADFPGDARIDPRCRKRGAAQHTGVGEVQRYLPQEEPLRAAVLRARHPENGADYAKTDLIRERPARFLQGRDVLATLYDGLDAVDVLVKFELEGLAARGLEIVAVQPRANPARLLVGALPSERADLYAFGRGYGEGESAVATEHLQRYRVPLIG